MGDQTEAEALRAALLDLLLPDELLTTAGARERLADEYQAIADGRQRSRITAIIARKVAEGLRGEV